MKEKKQDTGRLEWLLIKNTIAMLIPSILIFGIILMVTIHYPILHRMTCYRVGSLDELEEHYKEESYNVWMNVLELKYTGYDYYEDGKIKGAYYYTFMEDQCLFVLIKTKEPEPILSSVDVKGKLLGDSASLEAMKNEFAKEIGMDYETFNQVVYPIMLSEVDYPYLETILLWLLVIIPYILTGMIIVLSVFWTIHPYWHPSIRQLNEFGDKQLVYEEVKSQLRNRLIQHNYNYYITEEYLVISNWMKTDFIRIDYIQYISKHVINRMRGRQQVYRLTMSNPDKMFYEKDFKSEECADEIMAALIRLNPQIDNRTMKIFDLPDQSVIEEKPEAEDIIKETEVEKQPEEPDNKTEESNCT